MELRKIIRMAANEEDFFRDFYRAAAAKTTLLSAKTLLLRISAEEKAHKEKIQAFDFSNLYRTKGMDSKDEPSPDLAKPLMLTPLNEFNKIREIFDYAVRSESIARDRYSKLARIVDDDGAKWLFNFLAVEEKKHERLLTDEMRKFGV
jgi:rubrerythrin